MITEDKKGWNDSRLISSETLKIIGKIFIKPTPKTVPKERPGYPETDGEEPYSDGGAPR